MRLSIALFRLRRGSGRVRQHHRDRHRGRARPWAPDAAQTIVLGRCHLPQHGGHHRLSECALPDADRDCLVDSRCGSDRRLERRFASRRRSARSFWLGALIVLAAAVKPFGRLIERIPTAIAAAMLAGVLIRFVMAVFESAQGAPGLVLPLVGGVSGGAAVQSGLGGSGGFGCRAWPGIRPRTRGAVFTRGQPFGSHVRFAPAFDPAVLLGLGRAAVSRHDGVPEPARLRGSARVGLHTRRRARSWPSPGLASMLSAWFGAHTSNLAAISAAICTGPDTHPDPAKRWMVGPFYALFYLLFAAFSANLIAIIAALPPELIRTVAGLAPDGRIRGRSGVGPRRRGETVSRPS